MDQPNKGRCIYGWLEEWAIQEDASKMKQFLPTSQGRDGM